jgi:hypothetical protein
MVYDDIISMLFVFVLMKRSDSLTCWFFGFQEKAKQLPFFCGGNIVIVISSCGWRLIISLNHGGTYASHFIRSPTRSAGI